LPKSGNREIEKRVVCCSSIIRLPDFDNYQFSRLRHVTRISDNKPAAFLPPVWGFEPATSLQRHGVKEESYQSSATVCREGSHEHRLNKSGDGSIFECLHTCIFSTQSSNSCLQLAPRKLLQLEHRDSVSRALPGVGRRWKSAAS